MGRMTFCELYKVWSRKSFLVSIVVILTVNVFLLWYVNLSDGTTPELSSYKALEKDLRPLSEKEKCAYLKQQYDKMQGIRIVHEILMSRALGGEMGKALEAQKMEEYSDIYEKYYKMFQEESYLKYTKSMEQEDALICEVYEEMCRVASFHDDIRNIQQTRNNLGGISVFSKAKDDFSGQNIEKSAEDYSGLENVKTEFYPSKGVTTAMQNDISDILLVLSVLLFAGFFMYEEKEKRLFYLIRATAGGRMKCIAAKLLALFFHCIVIAGLIYGENLIFSAATAGLGNLFRSIQSVAPLMESNLHLNLLEYIALSIVTKAMAVFVLGAFVTFVTVVSRQGFVPYLAGGILIAAGVFLYAYIPAYASVNWLKYLNIAGLLKTENIYGGYLNFNLFDRPVSRMVLSVEAILLYGFAGVFLSILSFVKWGKFENKKIRLQWRIQMKPHTNLLRHESYKIFIMNKALPILLIFMALSGYRNLASKYTPAPKENYYQNMMLKLEGKLTPDKQEMIAVENQRYRKAFQKIEKIDEMVASGKLTEDAGEMMKEPYYSEVAFYPQFQRILKQYDFVKKTNGKFIYDTGYLYLSGVLDTGLLSDFMLITVGIILAFSHVMTMEHQRKAWHLIAATKKGKKSVIVRKLSVCFFCAFLLALTTWIARIISIQKDYPLHGLWTSLQSIPYYMESHLNIPVICWVFLLFLSEITAVLLVTLAVFLLSRLMKSQLQVIFTAVLVLLVPLIIRAMGFDFANRCSLFVLYTMFHIE